MLFLNERHETNINYEILEHDDGNLLEFGERWQKKINLHSNIFINN